MIHPNASDTATVRSVFVIGPDHKVKLTLTYPASTGRNFQELLRVIDSLQLTAPALGRDAGRLEAGRGRDHRARGLRRGRPEEVSGRLHREEAVPAGDAAAGGIAFVRGVRPAQSRCLLPHSRMAFTMGPRLLPFAVSTYSSRGGRSL